VGAAWAGLLAPLLLAACGGGAGSDPAASQSAPGVQLSARMHPSGTTLECQSDSEQLVRVLRDGEPAQAMTCPFSVHLADDYRLSRWRAETVRGAELASTSTRLVAPIAIEFGAVEQVLVEPHLALLVADRLRLRVQRADGSSVEIDPLLAVDRLLRLPPDARPDRLSWVATRGAQQFESEPRPIARAAPQPLGPIVGMAAARREGAAADAGEYLLGSDVARPGSLDYFGLFARMGLARLVADGRAVRDLRVADLDGDGRDDIVSNVYAVIDGNPFNCTLIAFAEGGGRYSYVEPTREDGRCVAGYGETILVADFDGDGRVDVFIPFYQRSDLLINQGGRRFVNVAFERGVGLPDYTPAPEGAAAVDIDLDGDVDIIVGNEVLINDGRARFTPLVEPMGPVRIFDEGLAVIDVDRDGVFDIVKHHPVDGPRVHWGRGGGRQFEMSALLLGLPGRLDSSYGLAAGDFTGNGLIDLALAGGNTVPGSPMLCAQVARREFSCLQEAFQDNPARQDLLVFIADPQSGTDALHFRTRELQVYRMPSQAREAAYRFRLELVDERGQRNQFGRALRATCSAGGALVGLRSVDGGSGFLAQGSYLVHLADDACRRIDVEVFTARGVQWFRGLDPGTHRLTVSSGPTGAAGVRAG
jgi:hypothetical protein